MKINFDKPLHDQDFKPILEGQAPKDGHKDERPTATLRLAIRRALMSDAKDEKDKTLSEDERFKRFQPAVKVDGAEIGTDFNLDEIGTIRNVARLYYGTLLYGQIRLALEAAGDGQPAKLKSNGKHAVEAELRSNRAAELRFDEAPAP